MVVHHTDISINGGVSGKGSQDEHIGIVDITAFLRRNFLFIAGAVALSMGLAICYVSIASPYYTAAAKLLIDPQQVRIASSDTSASTLDLGSAEIESLMEVVKSDAVALGVVRDLRLIESSELNAPPSLLRRVMNYLKSRLVPSEEEVLAESDDALRRAVVRYRDRLDVRRLGQSYVIQVSYTSMSPDEAARVANATAKAYIVADLNARSLAARRGSEWFQTRLVTLSEEAQRAAGAVEAFRAANGLVQTGRTASLDQEQLLERSSELSVTRAETTRLEARLATIEDLMSKPDMSGIVVSDVLGNTAVSRLRESLVTVSAEIRDLTARFGPESEASRSARATAETLQRGIREELERIRKAYAADLAAARRREQNVDTALDHMMVETTRRSQAHVELAELESRASTYRRLYEGVLMQFETATQKASFPVSDARIVTPAMVPLNRSHPQTMLILAMALAVGAASGLGTAVMRESLDRRIARSGQIRRELGLPFLGAVVHTRCGKQARMIGRLQSGRADPLEAVVVGRTSAFGESIRGVKASIDLALPQHSARVIMIASVADGEGKTTVASTLALLFAVEGSRVLLIDTKGDGPSLRERLAPTLSALADVLAPTPISQMPGPVRTCRSDPDVRSERGHLEVLSAATLPLNGKTQHRAAAAMIRSHLPLFRDRFDVVILDTPALERSSEARVLNPHVDGLVLVCEHRRTTVDRMAHAVLSFGATQHRLIGIVLNKVPRNWRND